MSRPKTALVLSGGGVRGAYEVGLVQGIVEVLGRGPSDPAPFNIFTGAAVGALNTASLACHGHLGDLGVKRLRAVWEELRIGEILSLRGGPLRRFAARLLGKRAPRDLRRVGHAIIDPEPLERNIEKAMDWPALRRNLDSGRVHAVVLAALEIQNGRTHMFADLSPGAAFRPSRDPARLGHHTQLTSAHVMASAAIPLVFPARRIGEHYFCDGGIRFNTPIAPAIRVGAERLCVVSLLHPAAEISGPVDPEAFDNPLFLLGKLLNALLSDPIKYDLQVLQRFNSLVEVLETTLDPSEMEAVREVLRQTRGAAYRKLDVLSFMPSADIGIMAGDYIRANIHRWGKLPWTIRTVLERAAAGGPGDDADLGSYLLYDGPFAGEIIELGRRDAHARAAEVRAFFE